MMKNLLAIIVVVLFSVIAVGCVKSNASDVADSKKSSVVMSTEDGSKSTDPYKKTSDTDKGQSGEPDFSMRIPLWEEEVRPSENSIFYEFATKNSLEYEDEITSELWMSFLELIPRDRYIEIPESGIGMPEYAELIGENGSERIENDDPRIIFLVNLFNESRNAVQAYTSQQYETSASKGYKHVTEYVPRIELHYGKETKWNAQRFTGDHLIWNYQTVSVIGSHYYLLDSEGEYVQIGSSESVRGAYQFVIPFGSGIPDGFDVFDYIGIPG